MKEDVYKRQEQINTTFIGKAAEALTTAGSVFKAMGLDSEALADGIMDKLTGARPVSYTHLDVYKRQGWSSMWIWH